MADSFRVFISAVSSEFRLARDAVASDLRARGLTVKVQRDFRQEAGTDTTLSKLHKYVSECDAVVALVGTRSGAFPSEEAAKPYAHLLPKGFARLSYTQWEVVFARAHGRRLNFFVPEPPLKPEEPPGEQEDGAAQQAFADWLFPTGDLDRDPFGSIDALGRKLLRLAWPDFSKGKFIHERFRSIGTLFKGRAKEMERLRELLPKGPTAVGARTPAIHGLGGIGKTRLALEYGVAHENEYTALVFLSAESEQALKADLLALHGALRLPDNEREEARVDAALDWLKSHPGWFLVLDNADTPEAIAAVERHLASLQKAGHALVTTRVGRFGAHFQRLELGVLSANDAAEFLLEKTAGARRSAPDDAETALLIARDDLDGLALALEQAGAQIVAMGWSLAQYRQEWRSNRDSLLGFHDDTVTGYPRAVAVTWQTSVNRLTASGRALLHLIAQFAPDPIPEAILATRVRGLEGDPRLAVAELARFSLVSRLTDADSFLMHRVVQDVTRRSMGEAACAAARERAVLWLVQCVGVANPGHADMVPRRATLLALAPHAMVLAPDPAGADDADPASPPAAWLLVEIGDAYSESGLSASAARFQRAAFALREKLAKADPNNAQFQRDLSISFERIGDLAVAAGDTKAAREAFQKALDVREKLAKADPNNAQFQRDLSISFERLGDLAVAAGDGKAARETFQKGLDVREKLAKADPHNAQFQRDLSISWNRIGDLAVAAGDGKAAREAFQKALDVAEKLAKADPNNAEYQRDLSISWNRIGNLAVAAGDGKAAREAFQKDLEIAEKLAKADPNNAQFQRDLFVSSIKIGDLAVAAGDGKAAREAFQKGLDVAEKLAKADPNNAQFQRDLSISWNKIGDLAVAAGDGKAAREAFQKGLDVAEKLAKADPNNAQFQRDLSISFERLGDLARNSGDTAEAKRLYTGSEAVWRKLIALDPGNADYPRGLTIPLERLAWMAPPRSAEQVGYLGEAVSLLDGLNRKGRLEPRYQPWLEDFRRQLKDAGG